MLKLMAGSDRHRTAQSLPFGAVVLGQGEPFNARLTEPGRGCELLLELLQIAK
jgi:hypothetical protein